MNNYQNMAINNNYSLNKKQLRRICGLLNQARCEFKKPVCAHLHVRINEHFTISSLAPFIRRSINTSISLSWTIEKKTKSGALHIHVMLIIDARNINPLTAFYKARKDLTKLAGVTSASIFKRKNEDSIMHNIKKYDQYLDAIYRFSYLAKTESKRSMPEAFKRTFGTSPIADKYFYIFEDVKKPKIVAARRNDSYSFLAPVNEIDQYINWQYQECRSCTHCFHMQDRATSENIGFLGLHIDSAVGGDEVILYISVESVYIKPEYRGQGQSALFVSSISPIIGNSINSYVSDLGVNQKLIVMNATSFLSGGTDAFLAMIEETVNFWCELYDVQTD